MARLKADGYMVTDAAGRVVADCYDATGHYSDDEDRARARLFAAAPELLAAVHQVLIQSERTSWTDIDFDVLRAAAAAAPTEERPVIVKLNRYMRPSGYEVPGDRADSIMNRSAEIMGVSTTRALWRLGFLQGSDAARAYRCALPSSEPFHWVLADTEGQVIDKFIGFGNELPPEFKKYV